MRQDDGLALLKAAGQKVTVGVYPDDYEFLSGTSMATPHVSGVAALVWALAPQASADDVRGAIIGSAHDLGDKGYDVLFGYGLVDAYAAAKLISPTLAPAPIAPAPPKHRPAPH
jgi:serine protease